VKIAIVLDDSLARPDGVQEYVRTIGRAMGESGHEVHVLCSGEAGQAPAGITAVYSLTDNVAVTFNGNGLRTPRPAKRSRLRAHLEQQQYDVIHVQTPHSPYFAARVVREARRMQGSAVRIVGTFHILPDGRVSEWGTRLLGVSLRRNLRLFDAFAAVSEPAVAFARWAFGVDATAIPNAVRIDELQTQAQERPWPADPAGRVVVAFLGRLVERKGALELVEAFAALPASVREGVVLRIGGRGPLQARVNALIDSHHLGNSVSLEGFVADEDKPGFLGSADLAVFPATGGESFGIVLTEAMACGAGAVLGGNNPGYSWTLGDSRAIINPRDTSAFALRLQALITDTLARESLHSQQRERVRDFDVHTVADRVEELYART